MRVQTHRRYPHHTKVYMEIAQRTFVEVLISYVRTRIPHVHMRTHTHNLFSYLGG